ncbi:MAG: hypothetical protein V3V99_11285 [candidate division Zixibacteria bacterium]
MQAFIIKATCLTVIIMIFSVALAAGQVVDNTANTIMYQGRLTDADGNPISAPVSVLFTIGTTDDISTVILYDTTMTVAADENGIFTVELGPLSTTVLDGSKRYLGINIEGDGEMMPRQLLTSAPASHTAARTSHEPGITYRASLPAAVLRDLSASVMAMDSVTIQVPSSGFIYVTATTSFAFSHIVGITDQVFMNISEIKSIVPENFGLITQIIPSGLPTGIFIEPVCAQRVFTIPAAGTYKFYVNSQLTTGYNPGDAFYNLEITACYFPTNYGTVSSPANTGADGIENAAPDLQDIENELR